MVEILDKDCNFTILEFDTMAELREYKNEHKDLFHFVGSSEALQPNGKYRLVY